MDIKDLNKPQLILLAVLLSFVTSIATGITTVTLMQQAPASVTAPINRVVQQTIEKIQQVEGKTITQTVIVKEEDLVVDAIAKNKSAVFTITKNGEDEFFNKAEVPAGFGVGISKEGIIVADASLVPDQGVYYVTNESGKFKAEFVPSGENLFSFLKIGDPVDEKSKISFSVPTFADVGKMKIGQKILVFGKTISSSIFEGSKDLKLNTTPANAGAVVLDLDGNVLGIALSGGAVPFAPIDAINSALKVALNSGTVPAESLPGAPVLASPQSSAQ